MINSPLEKATRAELDAELALYKKVLGADSDVQEYGPFASNATRADEVKRLQGIHGIPVELTPEFLKENEAFAKLALERGALEGDVIFGQPTEFAAAPVNDGTKKADDNKPVTTEKEDTEAPEGIKAVGVFDGDKLIRFYSDEDHGDNYAALAEQFMKKQDPEGKRGLTTGPYTPPLPEAPAPEETELVRILSQSGDLVRVFSLADHGEDYAALADQFLTKFAKRKYRIA